MENYIKFFTRPLCWMPTAAFLFQNDKWKHIHTHYPKQNERTCSTVAQKTWSVPFSSLNSCNPLVYHSYLVILLWTWSFFALFCPTSVSFTLFSVVHMNVVVVALVGFWHNKFCIGKKLLRHNSMLLLCCRDFLFFPKLISKQKMSGRLFVYIYMFPVCFHFFVEFSGLNTNT